MAEFLERRKVVKKEKQLGGRVSTVARETRKKRYSDARDEDLKLVKEGQELAGELESLGNYRATRATYKAQRKAAKKNKLSEASGVLAESGTSSAGDFDFSGLQR